MWVKDKFVTQLGLSSTQGHPQQSSLATIAGELGYDGTISNNLNTKEINR